MNCYLSRNYKGLSSAGNKAKTDIEQIMKDLSFKNVGLKQTTYRNKVLSFLFTLAGVLKAPFCLHRGDYLVLQYPLKKYFTFVCNMAHQRGAKVIVIIHDLGSFRRKALTVEQEISRLNHADYIIAHNEKMKKWLEDNGCKAKLGVLGIFDYLSETSAAPKHEIGSLPVPQVYQKQKAKKKDWADIWQAGNGALGLETSLPVMLTEGVNKGRITMQKLVEVMCENPAKLFRIFPKKGTLQVGADADVVLVDLNKEYTVDAAKFHSVVKHSPFNGFAVKGAPVLTMVRGTVVAENGEVVAQPGHGKMVQPIK